MANKNQNKNKSNNTRNDAKNNKNEDNPEFQWKKAGKTSFAWILIIITAISLSRFFSSQPNGEVEIEYSDYKNFLSSRSIIKAKIIDEVFFGELNTPQSIILSNGLSKEIQYFRLKLPFIDREVMSTWDNYGLEYSFKQKSPDWTGYFLNFLPWIAILAFWIFIMRRMQGGNGMKSIFNFGKSKAKIWTSDMQKVTFEDVAGCVEAKEELYEVVEFLKKPKRFQKLGAKIPRGALLVGPPGTGKTLLARAVAGEADVPFFNLSGADFVEMFVGVGASRVRDLFEQGKQNQPCIIFIDELDAVGRQRGAGLGGGHDEREQTLNALLVEMDGFEANENIIVMAATNRPDVLDAALLRPGRFDRQIVVDIPDLKGRLGILEVHTKKIVLNKKDINLEDIAKGTPGMVGADLENIVNEAALLAARKNKKSVDMMDFEDAKDKVMMGVQRKSAVLTKEDKKTTAYHEAGHTLVAVETKGADPVHKVTIIPRGRALGVTMQLPIDEKYGYARKYIEGRLAILMGGRAAEELIFKEMTTGAGNDIEQATSLARKMVCEWGMSDTLGPMSFGKKNEEVFLGREIQNQKDYSEETAKLIDDEVVKIVRKAQRKAKTILKSKVKYLHQIAEALLKYETINGDDLLNIMNGNAIVRSSNGIFKNASKNIIKKKRSSGKTASRK
ncbi:MAG: ATP-dependent metallopeptidase FtsH/Yme1/Tma family protein [bacterium TMED144]|nr:MAG: ATP-dependent metallopeptidase FtsH/Yme1/Tma family protein [bacterium TMED144]|tara:strand:- start:6195 stop:8210 length:2016 start_codon:yes stop_codon:yes gene_type:complete